jgi:uracil phosphoribosyltransferase
MNNPNVTIFDHPLISHKISLLRDVNTGVKQFRELIEEIATLMGYEALRDLPTKEVTVETPITTTVTRVIADKKLTLVPILRAGLGMVSGMLSLVPSAKVTSDSTATTKPYSPRNTIANFRRISPSAT